MLSAVGHPGCDESDPTASPHRHAKQLADSRTSRTFFDVSSVPETRKGSLMKALWRWNAVRGEYEAGPPPELHGSGEISAVEAFRNCTMLLMGGTGFVGKVFLAMILDRFPELRHLIVQVRRKKNVSGEQRFFSDILQLPSCAANRRAALAASMPFVKR